MIIDKKSSEIISEDNVENGDTSSTLLFPYPFGFCNRDQLNEHISSKLTCNEAIYYTIIIL
jgi:hypothetical protein